MSRPNLGEGGPLAGEGAGGVENGGSVEGESLGHGGGPKYQHPSMRYAGRGFCTGWDERSGGKEKGGDITQNNEKGKKKTASTPLSTPKSQEDNIRAHQAHKPTQHDHTHTWHMALPENKAPIEEISVGKNHVQI